MAEDEVLPLDSDLIKVLASDSRRDILRHLQERPMTVTELSRALDLRKATVSEHMKKLTDSGLITRRDDERLWVYYELSRSGKRIVNPGRTRFYLVVSAAVVAGIAALVMASLFLFTGPAEDLAADDSLNVEVGRGQVYAGGPASFQVLVQGPDGEPVLVDAYLLTPAEAEALGRGEAAAAGTPLSVQPAGSGGEATMLYDASNESAMAADDDADGRTDGADGAGGDAASQDMAQESAMAEERSMAMGAPVASGFLELRSGTPLEPGTYFLYVRDGTGRDNRLSMPAIQVTPVRIEANPSTWWRGLDGNATLAAPDGPPGLAATVQLVRLNNATLGAPALTLRMTDGVARLNATQLDAVSPGGYEVHLLPDGQTTWQRTGAVLVVREPQLAVMPRQALEGEPVGLSITVLAGERTIQDVPVLVGGSVAPTEAAGTGALVVSLPPLPPGTFTVQVGRLHEVSVSVEPFVAPAIEALGGGQLRLTVTGPENEPRAGVGVLLDDAVLGFTNATGQLDLAAPSDGVHTLGLQLAGGLVSERAVHVDGWNVTEAGRSLVVETTTAQPRPGAVLVEARLANRGPAAETATLVARENGQALAAETLTVAAGGNATRSLTVHVNRAGAVELSLEAVAVQGPALSFVNGTQPSPPTSPTAPPPPTGDTSAAARADAAERALAVGGAPLQLVVEDLSTEAPPLELRGPSEALLDERMLAEDAGAEAPWPGALVVLAVAVALAWGRRRS